MPVSKKEVLIGVLSLQGDFSKHLDAIRALNVKATEVRTPADLVECDGLIIPGGESTAMVRQIDFISLWLALNSFSQKKPIFGTCAGLILMAKKVEPSPMKTLELFDITVLRNAYGRQADSFNASIQLKLEANEPTEFHALFIRAPLITRLNTSVAVLGSHGSEPVLIRQAHHIGASFHPELTSDLRIHRYFLSIIEHMQGK